MKTELLAIYSDALRKIEDTRFEVRWSCDKQPWLTRLHALRMAAAIIDMARVQPDVDVAVKRAIWALEDMEETSPDDSKQQHVYLYFRCELEDLLN